MAGAPQSIAPSKSGRPPTGAAAGRAGTKKPSAAPFAPPLSLNDLKKARDAGALQRQLISSEADFGKFEVHAATLERALGEATARREAFGSQLARAGSAPDQVREMLKNAVTIGKHATADMQIAVEGVREAIGALREAREGLAARVAADELDVTDRKRSNTSPTHQMPQHPSEVPSLARAVTNVRDGVAACRKILKAADLTFSRSRAEMAAAASGVQAAVTNSRKAH